jgi:hypothetical protein
MSGPGTVPLFNYSKIFQTDLNLNHSKYGLLLLKIFEIKYGSVYIEIRNKFPYWSFSTFGTEFELKIREDKVYFRF